MCVFCVFERENNAFFLVCGVGEVDVVNSGITFVELSGMECFVLKETFKYCSLNLKLEQ